MLIHEYYSMSSYFVLVITTTFSVILTHPHDMGLIAVAEGGDVMLRCRATGDEPLTYQWMRVSISLP